MIPITHSLKSTLLVAIGVFYLFATWILWNKLSTHPTTLSNPSCTLDFVEEDKTNISPQNFHHITIASSFGFHHDVYMAVAWTLNRVLNSSDLSGSLSVFAPQPFGYGFGHVVEILGLFNGTIRKHEELMDVVSKGEMDMLILGTCEIDLRGNWNQELLDLWDARPDNNKFQLVCIVHNTKDTAWQPAITPWAARESIRFLTISEHVKRGFRHLFDEHADSKDPKLQTAGYENIPIDVHIPVLDVEPFMNHSTRNQDVLSNVVIQGSFDTTRRDYLRIFKKLTENLHEDPGAWGYLPLGDDTSYSVDPASPLPPFHLYLIGSGYIQIPPELTNVVSLHTGLDYPEFYQLMSTMDICLPAFAENGYYEDQASSTFAMAIECDVPILVTRRMQRAYTYVDDSITVARPAVLREMDAIKALRRSSMDGVDIKGSNKPAMEDMLSRGWYRSHEEHRKSKERIWDENALVIEKLLRGLV